MARGIGTTHDRDFGHTLERQMRNWELSKQVAQERPAPPVPSVQEFITISRTAGLPAGEYAAALAERLGWPWFDKEILHAMAGNDVYRRRLYESMDERDLGWLESVLRVYDADGAGRDDYFHRLRTTVLTLARKSPAIFLGRAADLILPDRAGLRVRLEASAEFCARAFAQDHGITEKEAERRLHETERERAQLIRRHFHVDAASPLRYDLILNMQRLSVPQAADITLAALNARRGAPTASPVHSGGGRERDSDRPSPSPESRARLTPAPRPAKT